VAVLPVSFKDGSIKKPKSVELVDYDDDDNNANTSHLVDIMRDVIISNNEAVAKSVINKRVENVLPGIIMQDSKDNKANQSSSSSLTTSSNKMYRQVAFEEETVSTSTSSTTKKVVEENSTASSSFHKTVNINDNSSGSKPNAITDTSNKIAPIVSPSSPTTIKIADRDEIKNAMPIGEDHGYGLVRLTVHYDELRTRFSVTLHEAR
jgi:hypothetical protein